MKLKNKRMLVVAFIGIAMGAVGCQTVRDIETAEDRTRRHDRIEQMREILRMYNKNTVIISNAVAKRIPAGEMDSLRQRVAEAGERRYPYKQRRIDDLRELEILDRRIDQKYKEMLMYDRLLEY